MAKTTTATLAGIEAILGDSASGLLDHTCTTIAKDRIAPPSSSAVTISLVTVFTTSGPVTNM